jgi:hypothetical protein
MDHILTKAAGIEGEGTFYGIIWVCKGTELRYNISVQTIVTIF